MPRGRVAEDISGQRFGRLVAIEMVGRRHGCALWKCVCDCGNEHDAKTNLLKSGTVSSCGCLKRGWADQVRLDITGDRYGRLTVLGRSDRKGRWLCKCDCGRESEPSLGSLRNGSSKSCGCAQRDVASGINRTHGMSRSSEYRIWAGMRKRCYSKKCKSYIDYGGRGIVVCERWSKFENFYEDMGQRPSPDHSLDRIDVDGNYEPSNCRWATAGEQARNRRKRISLTERYAAVICMLRDDSGKTLFDRDVAARLTAREIVAAFEYGREWDHYTPLAMGGTNHPVNLQPLTKDEHLTKTRRDIATIAKSKRIKASTARHRAKMIAKVGQDSEEPAPAERRKKSIPSRPFPNPPPGAKFDWKRRKYVFQQSNSSEQ